MLGQDLEATDDGGFRIARKVANDRVISTVDPEARHGHKTSARGFDGYKGHIALDPDSEIITATEVSAGNEGDAAAAPDLVADLVGEAAKRPPHDSKGQPAPAGKRSDGGARSKRANKKANKPAAHAARVAVRGARRAAKLAARKAKGQDAHVNSTAPAVYGDAAYGAGGLLAYLDQNGIDARVKTAPPSAPGGLFAKDRFVVDLEAGTVTCPAGNTVVISVWPSGAGAAHFGPACAACPLREACTTAKDGRTITISAHEELIQAQRERCADPAFAADYRATRPKVERKLAHLVRRRHGGRRARVRGKCKVSADFNLLAAAQNLARLVALGLRSTANSWAATGIA